jgi:hypothetical protein
MQATSRHATSRRLRQVGAQTERARLARKRRSARRLSALLTVTTASAMVVTAAAIASPRAATRAAALTVRHIQKMTAARNVPSHLSAPVPAAPRPAPSPSLTLTVSDRESCPAAATACVDLTRHLTWLQSAGQVTFGPVRAEPGLPGSAHATPRGTFQVSWKAGANFVSNIYNEPMPWAVFFAPGGIAFHGGSLTTPSHGCVHLTPANAHYYNEHLSVGAEVVVF